MVKEKEELGKFSNERLILEVLPALDNLFLAIEHAKPEQMESLVQGVTMTLEQILKGLEKFGVRTIDSLGEAFNPAQHEAMGKIESEEAPDTIVQEFQKGYLLHERLLRPARVMVAKPIEKVVESDENSSSYYDDKSGTDSSSDSADEN
jgi:molecular chaperone GrpE